MQLDHVLDLTFLDHPSETNHIPNSRFESEFLISLNSADFELFYPLANVGDYEIANVNLRTPSGVVRFD